ncbi:MAG: DUF1080 domain-containing protein [Bacteroidia bacterium]|nr:DUF1080 domain-containing protein [Bacteroidia bacterium]
MKYFLASVCISLIFWTSCSTPTPTSNVDEEEWISLFNGIDLTGWDIKITGRPINDNYLNTFRVQDSMLRISYDDYEQFGTYFGHLYYQKPYSYYKLKFEYRFVGEQTPGGAVWNVRNSGVMLHSQSVESVGIDQHFPVSIELQTLGGLGEGPRTTANLCTPGTMVEIDGKLTRDHCIDSRSETYDGDQWVTVEAVVLGDSIVHHIIGSDTVLTYTKPQIDSTFVSGDNYNWVEAGVPNPEAWAKKDGVPLTSGYIALQAESHPIDFRNIELLELEGCMDPKAKNHKSYYIKSAPEKCEY